MISSIVTAFSWCSSIPSQRCRFWSSHRCRASSASVPWCRVATALIIGAFRSGAVTHEDVLAGPALAGLGVDEHRVALIAVHAGNDVVHPPERDVDPMWVGQDDDQGIVAVSERL